MSTSLAVIDNMNTDYIPNDNTQHKYVSAHINNISFPKSINELETFIYQNKRYNVEDIINESENGYVIWTVPRSSAIDDIVLFFHAKTAIQWSRKLETAAKNIDDETHNKDLIFEWLKRARTLYSKYGGKIFAIGRIDSPPEYDNSDDYPHHWSGRIYAKVCDICLLNVPIDISEFNSFILVSRQSAITQLPSKEYEKLKNIIVSKNRYVPDYFLNDKIGDDALFKTNIDNFLTINRARRKRFLLEADFRSYYVDYFLKVLSGKKCYRECQCFSPSTPFARVDNIIEFCGKKILFEVKLNIELEKDLISQLNQYVYADYVILADGRNQKEYDFEKNYMFVIDMYSVYKYITAERRIIKIFDLDDLKDAVDICKQMKKAVCN